MDEIKSPCIKECNYSFRNNVCTGCYRTIEEIMSWQSFSNYEKELVLQKTVERKSKNEGKIMPKLEKGFIQVYTGNGKGKTTAAIGQAVRAAGAGMRTYFIQFMKEYPYSEIEALKKFQDSILVEQFCGDDFVLNKELPLQTEIDRAKEGLNKAKSMMLSGDYDLIVLDEVLVSIYFKLLTVEDLLNVIECKPLTVELILTGRYCPQEIIDKADLVTEMKEVKHYYTKGITSRKGIES
jgi:cob(I)alamin adenosyltransferase